MDGAMQVPTRHSEQEARAKRQQDDYLTAEKIDRLRRELDELKQRVLPEHAAEARRTAEMGDRSDNAAYSAAKALLTRTNNRIAAIEERLKRAIVIERGADACGRIRIGSLVTLSVDGDERTYEILGSQETSPSRGRISHRSPLGSALIGKAVGDDVRVTVGGRTRKYRVVRVE